MVDHACPTELASQAFCSYSEEAFSGGCCRNNVVYHFENEQLLELINRTAHAAALSALVETTNGYRFYFGVYVRSVSRFTPIYMALIDPFRKLVVYPSLLRTVRAKWNKAFGTA